MQIKSNKYFPFIIFILITVISLVPYADAMSGKPYSPESCKGDQLCESLEGKEFDMIKYSAMGSELIILYDKNKSGEIYPTSKASLYERGRSTVNNAIHNLSNNPDYDRFIIRKAWKSKGLFKAEDLDSVYIILPKYSLGEIEAPEYTFFEKKGKLRVRINPIVRMHRFGDD